MMYANPFRSLGLALRAPRSRRAMVRLALGSVPWLGRDQTNAKGKKKKKKKKHEKTRADVVCPGPGLGTLGLFMENRIGQVSRRRARDSSSGRPSPSSSRKARPETSRSIPRSWNRVDCSMASVIWSSSVMTAQTRSIGASMPISGPICSEIFTTLGSGRVISR